MGEPQLTFDIGAHEVAAAYLPIRVTEFGDHDLQITANGSQMSDAVVRTVAVLPDGKQTFAVEAAAWQPEQAFTVSVPAEAVPGTGRVTRQDLPWHRQPGGGRAGRAAA